MSRSHIKDPNAKKPYGVDWGVWLVSGDSIATAAWIVPTGIVKESESLAGAQATIWLSGGTDGQHYDVTSRITTALGMIDDQTIRIYVRQR